MNLKRALILIILINIVTSFTIFACPLKIINDNRLNIILVDCHNNQAVFIKSRTSAMIDPTIYSWQKHFKKEKFNVFYQVKFGSSQYLHRYDVTENYCTDNPDENKIKVSQFAHFMKTKDKRFTVKGLQPKVMKLDRHHENHRHHKH